VVYDLIKLLITALLIVAISEVAKRSTLLAAVLASIPLISVLAMIWLYVDTRDIERIAALATSVFWLVIPSLVLFISLPLLLRGGVNFPLAMGLAIGLTAIAYFLMVFVLQKTGVQL
jgi:uncharacterized membrane protein (GlpM family)